MSSSLRPCTEIVTGVDLPIGMYNLLGTTVGTATLILGDAAALAHPPSSSSSFIGLNQHVRYCSASPVGR